MWNCPVCREQNEDVARVCMVCGHLQPGNFSVNMAKTKLVWRSDRGVEVDILPPGGVISKDEPTIAPELFLGVGTVSSPHCELSYQNDRWQITDLNSLNGTDIAGIPAPADVPTPLSLPCRVRIGGVAGRIREELVDPPALQEEGDPEPAPTRWVIVCPNTRREYEVESADSRITQCECCRGGMARRISQARPVRR